ncbi:hypothetical protein B2K_12990 [Paenibacillus mucilaginosus K02]|uniref:Uncharacterized protein n=1 Tax=Paenibacillus mucilaginosus K02 TaxID=997761 RepID=I0BGX5_9BACL|nr:hypothetical protein B2K_12990 [Paenibacillus mucilaginosus K02]
MKHQKACLPLSHIDNAYIKVTFVHLMWSPGYLQEGRPLLRWGYSRRFKAQVNRKAAADARFLQRFLFT